jgi:hypothetical protein
VLAQPALPWDWEELGHHRKDTQRQKDGRTSCTTITPVDLSPQSAWRLAQHS